MSRNAKAMILVAVLAALAVGARFAPLAAWGEAFVTWIRSLGTVGAVVYFLVYITGTVLLVPGTALTVGSGFVYGLVVGLLIVSPASVLGATLAFLLARSVARPWVERRIARNPKFLAIDRAVAASGFKVVFLLRLEPLLAFTLLNYALGLTRVRLRDYVLASWIGMLPATILYVYLGSVIRDATQLFHGRPATGLAGRILFWGGLGAAAALVALLTRIAKHALEQELERESPKPVHAKGID